MRGLIALAALALCLAATGAFAQTYTVLHNFSGGPTDGQYPDGGVVSDGVKLYGITTNGGANSSGILYAMNLDGSGFTILNSFSDYTYTNGGLALSNGVLYGTTRDNSLGALYSIKTDGTAYTALLWSYSGAGERSPVVVSGDMIYGLTSAGGTTSDGTAYSIKTDGSAYTVAYNFAGSPLDGSSPWGGLLLENGTLYGATSWGGSYLSEAGTLFSMSPDGSTHTILHDFSGPDGAQPVGGLVSDGSRLYGLTLSGGANGGAYFGYGGGTIFAVDKNGANFQTLHDFSLDTAAEPQGSKRLNNNLFCTGLTRDGTRLYGTTSSGGRVNALNGIAGMDAGAIFTLNTDGTGYTKLYRFDGLIEGTGSFPTGTLLLSNGTLYGATLAGGPEDMGVVYSYAVPPAPPVDLTANKTTFFTTDWIAVRANISVISTPCYLFVRIVMPNGQTLYYERGVGFMASPTPYLGFPGTTTVAAPIWDYPILDTQFRGIATGVYYLEGGAIDAATGQYVGTVDRETLIVQ
ncbi:MAG: choice-of-anchor tandem repeat GloVer-containing protein [Chlamydiota bacterium]